MDKEQKIKEEIERLKNHTLNIQKTTNGLITSVGRGRVEAFNDILKFIDSLPEEPINFPHERNIVEKVFGAGNLESWEYEEAKKLVLLAKEELLKDLELNKESSSEDLAKEISKWRNHYISVLDNNLRIDLRDIEVIANHFAEWQLSQMKEILRTEYEKGRFDMREEMMKDALDGCVTLIVKSDTSSRNLFISTQQLYKELQKYDDGDKVKIIIFKPEQQ